MKNILNSVLLDLHFQAKSKTNAINVNPFSPFDLDVKPFSNEELKIDLSLPKIPRLG